MLRSLADDVENNRVEDTDAVDRVRVLGDRIDDLSSLVRFDASVVNTKISQVLQALGAKHRVGRPTVSTHSSPTKLSTTQPPVTSATSSKNTLPPAPSAQPLLDYYVSPHHDSLQWVPGHSAVQHPGSGTPSPTHKTVRHHFNLQVTTQNSLVQTRTQRLTDHCFDFLIFIYFLLLMFIYLFIFSTMSCFLKNV